MRNYQFRYLLEAIDELTITQVNELSEKLRKRYLDERRDPPEAAAAVGARVPRSPRQGGPGAAAMYLPDPLTEEIFGVSPAMSTAYRSGEDH